MKPTKAFFELISGKQTVWVSLSNSYKKPDIADNVEDVIKMTIGFFPTGFKIAHLDHSLRLTENVFNEVKNLAKLESNRYVPNNVLISESRTPSNILEGNPLVKLTTEPLRASLKKCVKLFNTYQIMIIIDKECSTDQATSFNIVVDNLLEEIWDKETILNAFHDDKILTLLDLLQSELKKMGIDSIFVTGDSESIKTWMGGNMGQILISTPAYIKGFECEAIVDFTAREDPQIYSRASIQVVKAPLGNLRIRLIDYNDVFENQDLLSTLLCKITFLLLILI